MDLPDRTIRFRPRADLVIVRSESGGPTAWTIKDPLTLRYFQLRAEEFAILELLDGKRSAGELARHLGRRFPGQSLSVPQVLEFVATLLKSGLLYSTAAGFGRRLADRSEASKRGKVWQRFASLLSIRIRGIDPEPILQRLEPITRIVVSPFCLALAGAMTVVAAFIALSRIDVIFAELPAVQSLVNPSNVLLLASTFVVIKVLHELGHAVACRRFGGECHEIGVLVVAFMPLLYCDVTDSWMNAKKWPRIAVSLAGMIVELTLAAICTLLWVWSVPGPEHAFFLNVALLCSVNTLLFNGNPLLRYDGYYVLSDLVGIPNLSSEARDVVWAAFDRLVFGIDSGEGLRRPRQRYFLLCYGVASSVYRYVVLFGIAWFVHHALAEYGFGSFSIFVVGPPVALAFLIPIAKFVARVRSVSSQTGCRRSLLGGIGFIASVALLLFVPLPYHIYAPFVVQPNVRTGVFVSVGGVIEEAVEPGSRVRTGDMLASIRSSELQVKLEETRREAEQLALRLKHLNARRGLDPTIAKRIPATEESLASARRRLARLGKRAESLTIKSERDGVVIAAPNAIRPSGESEVRLWTGTPLDAKNQGAFVAEQTLLCYVAEPDDFEAVLFVSQDSAEFIRSGLDVTFQPLSRPGSQFEGSVASVSSVRTDVPRRELVAGGLIALPSSSGQQLALFQARAVIESEDWIGTAYAPGTAKIRCGWMSLASRAMRVIRRTFATEL